MAVVAVGCVLLWMLVSKMVGGGQAEGVAAAPDMHPVMFQGSSLPVSDTIGPREVTATTASGFEQSQLGAALAAAHLAARSDALAGPTVFTPTINGQVAGDTATLLKERLSQYSEYRRRSTVSVPSGGPIPATRTTFTGWWVPQWNDGMGDVGVQLLAQGGSGTAVRVGITVRWDDKAGDWRLMDQPFTKAAESDPNSFTNFYEEGN